MSGYDTDDFAREVIERSYEKPVLVDFWAAWCGPCRIIGPVLERLAKQSGGDWDLRKLDTERRPGIARQYRITSIPAVKLFVDGEVKDEFVGALPEQTISQWLAIALPSKFRRQIEQAEALAAERKFGEAHHLLAEIIERDPSDEHGLAAMVRVELYTDPRKALETAERIPLGSEYFEAAEAVKTIARLFLRLEDPDTLDDAPVRPAYIDAIRLLREGMEAAAVEGFIEVIRRDRYYDTDGARKAVIAIFNLLGDDHETTKTYRNPFANALY